MGDYRYGAASYHIHMKGIDRVALAETVRLHKMHSIVDFFGKGLWKGDLGEMREDRPRRRMRRKKVIR